MVRSEEIRKKSATSVDGGTIIITGGETSWFKQIQIIKRELPESSTWRCRAPTSKRVGCRGIQESIHHIIIIITRLFFFLLVKLLL